MITGHVPAVRLPPDYADGIVAAFVPAWRTAEIVILRHQLAVLQRRQPCRPNLHWADRALLATVLGVVPKARRQGCACWSPGTRSCAGIAISSAAAGLPDPCV